METFLIKALQLILSLSLLVVVHEFGHFLFAKLFKIRVEKFYLFFNPGFSLFKFKPKNSDTEYGIGWLPLGGYVKIAGMIDESMDKEQMAQPPKPWEFRTKPAWQRLLVMFGGVLFNFILALFIFSMMVLAWGDTYMPLKNVKSGMIYSQTVKNFGFQDGDILISADGEELEERDGILRMNTMMAFYDADKIEIERNGQRMTIDIPAGFADSIIASKEMPYMPKIESIIDSVLPELEAARIGLQRGDTIVKLNGKEIKSQYEVIFELSDIGEKLKEDEVKDVEIVVKRDTALVTSVAKIDQTGKLGFMAKISDSKLVKDEYGFFASFPKGAKLGVAMLKSYISQTRFIFSKEGAKNVGGFGAIGSMFPAEWDWFKFWTMSAFLSLALAFMNILPIPMLDGGHIMFLLIEAITGRPVNEKFQEYAGMVGLFLLLALLIFANGNDIFRAIFN